MATSVLAAPELDDFDGEAAWRNLYGIEYCLEGIFCGGRCGCWWAVTLVRRDRAAHELLTTVRHRSCLSGRSGL